MRSGDRSRALRLLTLIAALITLGVPASADDEASEETRPQRTSREILAEMDQPERPESWLRQVHLKKRRGFEYRRPFRFGHHGIEFALQGPLMRKKTPGLAIEIRF
jgi:hypothetical protein